MTERFWFADAARKVLEHYLVPAGKMSEIFVAVGDALDDSDALDSFELVVLQRAFTSLREDIAATFRPRSPLEAQLEYDRARNESRDAGYEIPEWVAAEDPAVLERWARWNERDA